MDVYIANFGRGTTAAELKEQFAYLGNIVEVEMVFASGYDVTGKDFAIIRLERGSDKKLFKRNSATLAKTVNAD